ncbi:DUF1963 domain-containing protein [Streptomyces yangpuensis]|uniref:DUF1963 domain-containing protein n=1 Tax=Streptomyces yangpuensis TaxID=1648182 RepID=UPI00371ED84D
MKDQTTGRRTPARPFDVVGFVPGLADWEREAVRLHPRPGAPSRDGSSVGGPLLWPADEAWPVCARMHQGFGTGLPDALPVPMVPVVQAFRSDLPPGVVPFPEGKDLLQVLWCPFDHEFPVSPWPVVVWRDSTAVREVLPQPAPDPGASHRLVPAPCVVHPERVTEYPTRDLPEELAEAWQDDFRRLSEAHPLMFFSDVAEAPGIKLGGYPSWFTWEGPVDCEACGRPVDHLLTVASWECDGDSWRFWLPLEDRDEDGGRAVPVDPTGLDIGGVGSVYVFECRTCPDRPVVHLFDSS